MLSIDSHAGPCVKGKGHFGFHRQSHRKTDSQKSQTLSPTSSTLCIFYLECSEGSSLLFKQRYLSFHVLHTNDKRHKTKCVPLLFYLDIGHNFAVNNAHFFQLLLLDECQSEHVNSKIFLTFNEHHWSQQNDRKCPKGDPMTFVELEHRMERLKHFSTRDVPTKWLYTMKTSTKCMNIYSKSNAVSL